MASRYFIPTSGEYAWTGSVWAATATGAAGSAVTPVDGDDVYILNGTARITSALDQSAIQLNSLTIGFDGEIGTSAASLQIGLDTSDNAHISGNGTLRLTITQTSASTLYVYDNFFGSLTLNGGALSSIYCARNGSMIVSGNTAACDVLTMGCSVIIRSATAGSTLSALYGNHRCECSMSLVNAIGGATITVSGAASGVTFQVYVNPGGRYVHDSGGTIANIISYTGGRAVTTGAYGGFTVTSSTVYAGAQLFERPSVPITYTNATTKFGFR